MADNVPTQSVDERKDGIRDGGDEIESKFIKVRVISHDTKDFHFRIKATISMSNMKKRYSERVGVPMTSLRFLFNGKRITDIETPKMLEMEDEDVIEVFQRQDGGK